MRNFNKKHRIIIIALISTGLIIALLSMILFFVTSSSNNDNKSDFVSYPLNEESQESKDITFSLNSSPLNPVNGSNINFNSVWDGEYVLTENTSSILVASANIEMYVFIGSGETDGLYNKVSQLGVLSNPNFKNPIMKVATDRLNITYSNSVSSELNEFVFYSDQFKFRDNCNVFGTSYDGCGTQEIKGAKGFEGISVGVFCATDTQDDFSICDSFIENLKLKMLTNTTIDIEQKGTEELLRQSYTYEESYILPGFSISYPMWKEKRSESSGSWDIELKNGDSEISIDLSAQGALSFEQSLSDWVTNWGSYNIEYTYTEIENGTLQGDRNYVIYRVNQSEKNPYLIAIVDVAKMYEGKGHLAIKSEQETDLDSVKEILLSIQTVG